MTAICFVFGLFFGTLASSSAPLLSSKSVHLMFSFAFGIFRIDFSSLCGRTSLAAVDKAMHSASVVLSTIYVCILLKYAIGQLAYLIMHPVLDLTEFSSSHVSLV